jgi:hypothetical protein
MLRRHRSQQHLRHCHHHYDNADIVITSLFFFHRFFIIVRFEDAFDTSSLKKPPTLFKVKRLDSKLEGSM